MLVNYVIHLYLKYTHKRIDYNLYLQTNHWQKVKRKALKRADYKCMLCSSRKELQIHHNNYDCLFIERRSDVVCLCQACHKTFHYYRWNNARKKAS